MRVFDHKHTFNKLWTYLKSKGNQPMKFGQLIEYNMRNIFLKKSYKKCSGEIVYTICFYYIPS